MKFLDAYNKKVVIYNQMGFMKYKFHQKAETKLDGW